MPRTDGLDTVDEKANEPCCGAEKLQRPPLWVRLRWAMRGRERMRGVVMDGAGGGPDAPEISSLLWLTAPATVVWRPTRALPKFEACVGRV